MALLHLRVHGVVQGVGFRWFTQRAAARLGLAGWVRNRPDGTVEVAAEGEPAALATLRAEVERGPSGARVTRVEEVAGTPDPPPSRPFQAIR